MKPTYRDFRFASWFHYTVVSVFSLFSLIPILWVLSASFQPKDIITSDKMSFLPSVFTVENYVNLIQNTPFIYWLRNSLIVASATTLIGLFLASTAAFAFSQFRFKFRLTGLYAFLFVQMFPAAILILPLYQLMSKLNLLDNFGGLIIAYCTVSLPFCVWMLKGFFDTIPRSLMESASIDGLNSFQIFYRIVMPLSLPGLSITAFFSFITAWNEFMFANTFMYSDQKMTIAVGLKTFLSQKQNYWEYLTPGAILVTLPILIFFILAQKWLISGLTAGSVKG